MFKNALLCTGTPAHFPLPLYVMNIPYCNTALIQNIRNTFKILAYILVNCHSKHSKNKEVVLLLSCLLSYFLYLCVYVCLCLCARRTYIFTIFEALEYHLYSMIIVNDTHIVLFIASAVSFIFSFNSFCCLFSVAKCLHHYRPLAECVQSAKNYVKFITSKIHGDINIEFIKIESISNVFQ